jgi:hypothetical protein
VGVEQLSICSACASLLAAKFFMHLYGYEQINFFCAVSAIDSFAG